MKIRETLPKPRITNSNRMISNSLAEQNVALLLTLVANKSCDLKTSSYLIKSVFVTYQGYKKDKKCTEILGISRIETVVEYLIVIN